MRSERLENEDKYLCIFKPEVNEDTTVCCCASIKTGNIFVSIILLICSCLYFFEALYSTKYNSLIKFFNCLIYIACGGFLLYGAITEKYIFAKISYIIYEIIFFIKLILFIFAVLINFILIFIKLDWHYIFVILALLLTGFVELGIMSYLIYIIYCLLVIIKDNNTYQLLEENQKLLKDYDKDEKGEDDLKEN